MKRMFALLLAILTAFALVGCTGGGNDVDTPIDIGTVTPAPTETPEPGLGLAQPEAPVGMIAAGSVHTAGLRADGTAITAGHDTVGQRGVANWADVIFLAAGDTLTAGVKADGTLLLAGELAPVEAATAWTGLSAVAVGKAHVVGLKADGTVVAAGSDAAGECQVAAWADVVAVAAGDSFTVGLTSAGTLVTAGAAPDVSGFVNVTAIAAGGNVVAALTNAGAILHAAVGGTIAGADALGTGFTAIGAGAFGVVGVKADGTVAAALTDAAIDLSAEADVVAASVGTAHVALMHRDGTVSAYGNNDDLQCAVNEFFLRPHLEPVSAAEGNTEYYLIGFKPGMTVAEANVLLRARTGNEASFLGGEGVTDGTLVQTGLIAYEAEGTMLATVVLMGDVTCDGIIDAADAQAIANYVESGEQLTAPALRAARVSADADWNAIRTVAATVSGEERRFYTNTEANRVIAGMTVINNYVAGTGKIAQYGDWHVSAYQEAFNAAYAANEDTVGYIRIDGTNIDYQIMFDRTGRWYYNDHTPEKKEAASGSLYTYSYGYIKNNIVTGHNSRPSGSMFHQLHHIQEFNLGESNCLHTRNCGKELTDELPDLSVYAGRVWTLNLFGVDTRYEIFAMYETQAGIEEEFLYDNVWFYNSRGNYDYRKQTDELVQAWIDKQLERSEIEFDTTVTPDDTFLTIFTCGNEHADAARNARLYYFLKRVD